MLHVLALVVLPWLNQVQQKVDEPLQTLELTATKDVTAAQQVDESLSALGQKVTACVTAGETREVCRCRYPDILGTLRKRYDALIKDHPDWKDRILSYKYENKEGRPVSGLLVLRNLRRQLEALSCEPATPRGAAPR